MSKLKLIFNSEKFLTFCELFCYFITLLFVFIIYTGPFLGIILFPYLQNESGFVCIIHISLEYIKIYILITLLSFSGILPRTLVRSYIYWFLFLSYFLLVIFFILFHVLLIGIDSLEYIYIYYLVLSLIVIMLIQFIISLSSYRRSVDYKTLLIKEKNFFKIKKSRLILFVSKPWKKLKVIKTITFKRKN